MGSRTAWLRFVGPILLALIVLAGGWRLADPDRFISVPTDLPSAAAVARAAAEGNELLCREYGRYLLTAADQLVRTFHRHAVAHLAYRQHRIPFGPATRLGTVLNIWGVTLRARVRQAIRYHEFRDAWRHACLGRATPCSEWGKAALAMTDLIDRAFARHAAVHLAYRQGRIPFGPANRPGTVLYVWATTLHAGHLHAAHYQEVRGGWSRACLIAPAPSPDQ